MGWDNLDLRGLTLGVFWPWFRHATPDVVAACEALLDQFTGMGAAVREVAIPDLPAGRVAHTLTIASEMWNAASRRFSLIWVCSGCDGRCPYFRAPT